MIVLPKFIIKLCHFFTKNVYDETFVSEASEIKKHANSYEVICYSFGVKLISVYKKSELKPEQIEFIESRIKK